VLEVPEHTAERAAPTTGDAGAGRQAAYGNQTLDAKVMNTSRFARSLINTGAEVGFEFALDLSGMGSSLEK
jgi:hypothetical protein